MPSEDDRQHLNGSAETCLNNEGATSGVDVNRRELLIGGIASVVASQAAAAASYLDIFYEDSSRGGLVVAWVEPNRRFEWRLRSITFAEPPSGSSRRFVLKKTKTGWQADLSGCSFPGGFSYDLQLHFTAKPNDPSLEFRIKRPGANNYLVLKPSKSLIDFIKAANSLSAADKILTSAAELSGVVSRSKLADIANLLFGEAFEHNKSHDVKLCFHAERYWLLRCGDKIEGGVGSQAQKANRFSALAAAEGLDLRFKEIAFSVFSEKDGGIGAAAALQLDPQSALKDDSSSKSREDVRALFSGDGAPPPLANKDAGRVLYALVRHSFAAEKAGNFDRWSGELSFGRKEGSNEKASLTIADDGKALAYLGWRNSSDSEPVLALQAPATLAIDRGSGTQSRFEGTSARIWRAKDRNKVLRFTAALRPEAAPMMIQSRFGPFVVAPLPPLPARPGQPARVPAIRIGASKAKAGRILSHFAAPLALESAAINVVSERLKALLEQTGAGVSRVALRNESWLFSQLTFDEAECLFHIGGVPRQFTWPAKPALVSPPSTEPPQAEAIIDLGKTLNAALPVRISLRRATLLVRRPADLLALTYRFQDLVLERDVDGWFVRPDRRLAAFRASAQPLSPLQVGPICGDEMPAADNPARYQPRNDPRPLLVVEFPPQHIAEQAFFRRGAPEPKLPVGPPGGEPAADEADTLRDLLRKLQDVQARVVVRNLVRDRQNIIGSTLTGAAKADWDKFIEFRKQFETAITAENTGLFGTAPSRYIPADQSIYIGPAFLDLETARIARRVQRGIEDKEPLAGDPERRLDQILRNVPEVELSKTVILDLRGKHAEVIPEVGEEFPDNNPKNIAETTLESWLNERDAIKSQRDPFYRGFGGTKPFNGGGIAKKGFYDGTAAERAAVPGLAKVYQDAIAAGPDRLPGPFYGRRNILARVKRIATEAKQIEAARAIAATVEAFELLNENEEPFAIPAEARVSGRSRLVFRIPADDFEGGRADSIDRQMAGAFPFTIEALTNWGGFDLAVVRRAEKVFEPLAGWARDEEPEGAAKNDQATRPRPHGGLKPRWAREETRDEAAKLLHQGIVRGDAWAVRSDQQRQGIGQGNCPWPLVRRGTVTAAERMANVLSGVREPGPFETSIEIPFRLMLSPAQDAIWRTPLDLPLDAVQTDPARRIAPLWFAQLDETPGASSVRAVWSPDFRPEPFLDRDVGSPPRGPWAPWAMSRDVTTRWPYETEEQIEDNVDPAKRTKRAPERFRTGLDVADRHELVALSSLYGLPARGRRATNGALTDGSQIDPPPGFRLRFAGIEELKAGDNKPADYSAIYRPQPIGVSEMTLTALGGSLDADTNFVPPAAAKVVMTKAWKPGAKDVIGDSLFDALSIERWQQQTQLGRDILTEVVYKGFLFPLGHRCSLVKLTERRFVTAPGKVGDPVAYLVQRLFLRVGAPVKAYPAIGQPNGGRSWPPERVEILTRVTPDILDPADTSPAATSGAEERPNGRIFLRDANNTIRPGMVFWPRVRARKGGEISFELQIDGRGSRTRMPLIFVDNTAANDIGAMKALTEYYNGLSIGGAVDDRCVLSHGGDKRKYAAETEPDGTSFETATWIVAAEGQQTSAPLFVNDQKPTRRIKFDNTNFDFGALLQGVDQPPFFPRMYKGAARIAQVDRLVGSATQAIEIYYDQEYRAFGFPPLDDLDKYLGDDTLARAKTDVYLDFATPVSLDPGRNGERSGGAVRPNTELVALSRSRGPVGNKQTDLLHLLAVTGDVDQNVPRSTGLDRPDPGTFFSGAKLLGIVDLGEALKFVTSTLSNTPQFKEVTEYASVLLNDLSDGEAAAVAKIRDQLLVPLRGALLTLAQEFHRATAAAGAVFDEDQAVARLGKLYPDVGKAYRDLQQALDNAISSTGTDQNVEALLAHFAAIYAAGQRFIRAIDRVANDPIAPVREALREAFNKQIGGLIGQLQTYVRLLEADLKKIATQADAKIRALVTDEVFRPWRRLVFALPGPHALDSAAQLAFGDAVRKAVDDALSKALPAEVLVQEFLKGPGSFANYAGDRFAEAFENAIATATGGLKTALQTARDTWMFGAISNAERIKGLLFDTDQNSGVPVALMVRTLDDLSAFLNAAINVAKAQEISGIAAALRDFANTAASLVRPPIDFNANAAVAFCQSATTAFNELFKETLNATTPLFPGIDTARTGVQVAFDNAIKDINAFSPALAVDAEELKHAVVDDLLGSVIGARDRLERGAKSLGALTANVCGSAPDKLQLDAFAVVKRTRQSFVETLNDLNRSFANAAAVGVGGRSRKLLATLVAGGANADVARKALVSAIAEALGAERIVCRISREATVLRAFPAGTPLEKTKALLVTLAAALPQNALKTQVQELLKFIESKTTGAELTLIRALSDAVDKADTDLGIAIAALLQTTDGAQQLLKLEEARKVAEGVADTINQVGAKVIAGLEQHLLSAVAEFLLAGQPYLDAILSIGLNAMGPIFTLLAKAQGELLALRTAIAKDLGCSAVGAVPNDGDLSTITLEKVCGLLVVGYVDVDKNTGGQPRPGLTLPTGDIVLGNDYLVAEAQQLVKLTDPANRNFAEIKALLDDWTSGNSSIERLARQLGDAAAAVLSGDLKRIVDLESARRRIEEKLKEMSPSRIVLKYDLSANLHEAPPFFLPKNGSKIKLAARATYDLVAATTPPVLTATCQVDAFDINLFGVVTLGFDGAQFVSASDKGSDFNVIYRDFTLGPSAEFLKPLQSLMNPGGNGPYVRPSAKFAGIEIGYVLDLGTVSVGTLSFINVSITASCDLPFGKGAAQFTASIGREDRPVLLSCLPYVGGGFLTLYADAKSLIGFAASFEFGGGGAFAFGPLRGQGRISTGIYLRKMGSEGVQIDGFFYCGGEAQIACFAIAASLMVRVSHRPDGTMVGSAVFTFSFSIGFAKLRYSVRVSRTMGKGFSSSAKIAQTARKALLASNVMAESDVVSLLDDWKGYDRYFSSDFDYDGVFE